MLQRIIRVTNKILTAPNQSIAICLSNLKRSLSFGNMQRVDLLVDVRKRSARHFDRNIRNGFNANTSARSLGYPKQEIFKCKISLLVERLEGSCTCKTRLRTDQFILALQLDVQRTILTLI